MTGSTSEAVRLLEQDPVFFCPNKPSSYLEPLILAEVRFCLKSPAYEMLICEMFIIGVGQAGSGPKQDGTEILSPREEREREACRGPV